MSQTDHSRSRLIGVALPIGLLVLCISLLLWAYPLAAGQAPLAVGGAWQIQAVDAANNVGRWTSLALDSSDAPHISYQTAPLEVRPCAMLGGQGRPGPSRLWIRQDGMGGRDALDLDAADRPHIAYFIYPRYPGNILRYARVDWHRLADRTLSGASGDPDLALDAADQPHIYAGGKYLFGMAVPGRPNPSQIASTEGSLALDKSDAPYVVCEGRGIRFAQRDTDGWHVEVVSNSGLLSVACPG